MISIFLAKAFSIYLVVMSLAMLTRKKEFRQYIDEFSKNKGLILFASAFVLILGILLVLTHNIWMADWRVLITLLAWMTFIKALVYLFYPNYLIGIAVHYKKESFYYITAVLTLIVGLYLGYIGFIVY